MNFMLDIETLSTRPNGVILSIGMCRFDPKNGVDPDMLEIKLDLKDQMKRGRHVCIDTICWWMGQSSEARMVFRDSHRFGPEEAFKIIYEYLEKHGGAEKALIWANGASFDQPFCEDYFKDAGLKTPWRYYNNRCFRTYAALTKCNTLMTEDDETGHHTALGDAIWQATAMIRYMKKGEK